MHPRPPPADVFASLPPVVVTLLEYLVSRIAKLEAENAALRTKLGMNPTNSSKPLRQPTLMISQPPTPN
jgi:hypothetical protein